MNNSIKITKFLDESNKIEGVYDAYSLDQALHAWEYVIEQNELSIGVILKTHKILMLNKPLYPNEIGYLREVPVYIGGREAIHYSQIKEAIQTWTHEEDVDVADKYLYKKTVGMFLTETKEAITVVQSRDDDGEEKHNVDSVMSIPKVSIKKINHLKGK